MITPPASGDVLPPSQALQRRPSSFPWLTLVLSALGLIAVALLLVVQDGARLLIALCFAGILFFLVRRTPVVGVAATLVYLCIVGGLRRWLIPVYSWTGADPLLLVGPLVVVLYLLTTRRTVALTRLARLLLGLMGVMLLEVANPLQGGIVVGLTGVLLYFIPLLWFFAGRQLATPHVLRVVFRTVIAVALLGAAYGLYQTWFGFNAAELMWIDITRTAYAALGVGGVTRAFSFFTSAAEYSRFMGFGIVLAFAFFLRGSRAALLAIPLLLVGLFFEAVRTSIVNALIACVILWAVQARDRRTWLLRGIPALLFTAAVTVWSLQSLHTQNLGSGQSLASHTVNGLVNPGSSTAPEHLLMIGNGILKGFLNPIGFGLGSTTSAGVKFGSDFAGDNEYDFSNMFTALGFIGGLLYLIVICQVLAKAFWLWQRSRSVIALGLLGILLFGFGQWLNGGEYATCVFVWICVGAVDRFTLQPKLLEPHPPVMRP